MPETYKNLTFEPGNLSNWSGTECANPATDVVVQNAIVRANQHFACHHRMRVGAPWVNGSIRSLAARYDTDETVGQAYYWRGSVYLPSGAEQMSQNSAIFEWHAPASIYKLGAQASVAPYMMHWHNGDLVFRIFTGDTNGGAFTHQEAAIMLAAAGTWNHDQWIDWIFMVDTFSETSGSVKFWIDLTGTATFVEGSPAISRSGIPTTQFSSSHGIHNIQLYTEHGPYVACGCGTLDHNTSLYSIGEERFPKATTTFAQVVAAFGGSGGSAPVNTVAPVISGSAVVGNTLSVSNGTWTGSPTSFAYQWQRDNQGGGTYTDIPAATASVYVLANPDSGCRVRCKVLASN